MMHRFTTAYRATSTHTAFFAVLLLLFCTMPVKAAAQQVGEYHIKAVFLTNLTHFVTWPENVDRENAPFIIGIYGPDPFDSILDKAVAGEKKNNRPLKIERYHNLQELDPTRCNILFIHDSKVDEWKAIQSRLANYPILTVGDTSGFPEQGGMVNLIKNGQKIQVEINHNAVQKSGLTMSSKLLSLARIVP
ncbi:YfiR family protein [Desulfopila aestuarii]|uniref:Transmembrane protein n=1 Tax=Desulfopila aestuarii DSM 18488 TaxID=1121416 RepID=A0A1M7Y8W3_9BACT|nr:YfiR family protein [Desulfopila aestuarii]SHO49075.1 protein of unknown function [Desulfopila aestuarii DSM 18488]